MEITTENFHKELEDIKQAIQEWDFIAMDTEFTGLEIRGKAEKCDFDNTNILYRKHKFICEKFQAIQVGLAIFTWNEQKGIYYSRPYNFYVLPTSELEGEDKPMMFDPGTCKFLEKHNFSWNMLFQSGISYKQSERKDQIETKWRLVAEKGYRSRRVAHALSSSSKRKLKQYIKQIQDFWFDKNKTKLTIEEESSSVRTELRKQIFRQLNVKNVLSVTKNGEDPCKIEITKNENFDNDWFWNIETDDEEPSGGQPDNSEYAKLVTTSIKYNNERKVEEAARAHTLFRKEYGFTDIVDQIVENKKPLVAHNCLFDLIYFYRQFIGDLPKNFNGFRDKWRDAFPFTFDTKYISWKIVKFPKSDLGNVYKFCTEGPKYKEMVSVKFHPGFDKYKKETKCHEAGYDAHMTGWVFATLCKFQEVKTQFHNHKKEYEGVEFKVNEGDTDDSGDEQIMKGIVASSRKQRIKISALDICNLKIVRNQVGGNYLYLGEKEVEADDSMPVDGRIQELLLGKENCIWVEISNSSDFAEVEISLNNFGDIIIVERSSKGILADIKDLNMIKYKSLTDLIKGLNEDENFNGSIWSYKEYLELKAAEQEEKPK